MVDVYLHFSIVFMARCLINLAEGKFTFFTLLHPNFYISLQVNDNPFFNLIKKFKILTHFNN
jgi:hypothetical protein